MSSSCPVLVQRNGPEFINQKYVDQAKALSFMIYHIIALLQIKYYWRRVFGYCCWYQMSSWESYVNTSDCTGITIVQKFKNDLIRERILRAITSVCVRGRFGEAIILTRLRSNSYWYFKIFYNLIFNLYKFLFCWPFDIRQQDGASSVQSMKNYYLYYY